MTNRRLPFVGPLDGSPDLSPRGPTLGPVPRPIFDSGGTTTTSNPFGGKPSPDFETAPGVEIVDTVPRQPTNNSPRPPRTGRPFTPPRQTPQDFPEINWSGDRAPLALIYGRARVRCFPVTMVQDGSALVFLFVAGLGEINAIESVWINSQEYSASNDDFDGFDVNTYTGTTSQTADPLLSSAISGYADDLDGTDSSTGLGTAYVAISIPVSAVSGVPFVEVIAEGRKVLDPRTSPPTTAYSDNPALILRDIITNTDYGWGLSVDDNTVAAAADACDEIISGSPSSTRRTLGLALYDPRQAVNIVQEIAEYAGVILDREGNTIRMVPDRPRSADLSLNGTDHIIASSYQRKRATQIPDAVEVSWYDVDSGQEKTVRQPNDDATENVIRARLTGITNFQQAKREAIERYNRERLEDLTGTVTIAGRGFEVQVGDVVEITDRTIAITNKPFRVLGVSIVSPGVFRLSLSEYQAGVYSDDISAEPVDNDTGLPPVQQPPNQPGAIAANTNINSVIAELNNSESQLNVTISVGLETDNIPFSTKSGYQFNYPAKRFLVEAYDDSTSPEALISRTIQEAILFYGASTPSGNESLWRIDGIPVSEFVPHRLVIREISQNGLLSEPREITSSSMGEIDNRGNSRYQRYLDSFMSLSVSGGDLILDWTKGVPFGGDNFRLELVRTAPSFNDFGEIESEISLSDTSINLGTSYFDGTGSQTFNADLRITDRFGRNILIGQILDTVTV